MNCQDKSQKVWPLLSTFVTFLDRNGEAMSHKYWNIQNLSRASVISPSLSRLHLQLLTIFEQCVKTFDHFWYFLNHLAFVPIHSWLNIKSPDYSVNNFDHNKLLADIKNCDNNSKIILCSTKNVLKSLFLNNFWYLTINYYNYYGTYAYLIIYNRNLF